MMDKLLTLLQSDSVLSVIKYGFGGVGCTLLGAFINRWSANRKNRLQTMSCYYIEDEVLSKIPIKNENNTVHEIYIAKSFGLSIPRIKIFSNSRLSFNLILQLRL